MANWYFPSFKILPFNFLSLVNSSFPLSNSFMIFSSSKRYSYIALTNSVSLSIRGLSNPNVK